MRGERDHAPVGHRPYPPMPAAAWCALPRYGVAAEIVQRLYEGRQARHRLGSGGAVSADPHPAPPASASSRGKLLILRRWFLSIMAIPSAAIRLSVRLTCAPVSRAHRRCVPAQRKRAVRWIAAARVGLPPVQADHQECQPFDSAAAADQRSSIIVARLPRSQRVAPAAKARPARLERIGEEPGLEGDGSQRVRLRTECSKTPSSAACRRPFARQQEIENLPAMRRGNG